MRSNFFRVFSVFISLGMIIFAVNAWAGCGGGGHVFGDGGRVLCDTRRSTMEGFANAFYLLFILSSGFIGLLISPFFEKKWFFHTACVTAFCISAVYKVLFSPNLLSPNNIIDALIFILVFVTIAFVLWYWPLHRSKMVLIFGIYISLFHYFIRLLATWASHQTPLMNMVLCIALCIIFLISSAWIIYRIYKEIKPKEKSKS